MPGIDGQGGCLERLRRFVQCDQPEVFAGCVVQECLDGSQAQINGFGLVVPDLLHPDQPCLDERSIEVVEADVLAFDVLGADQEVDVALQGDAVGLDGFRGQGSDLGHEVVEVVACVDREVRIVVAGVPFHSNPTFGSVPWVSRVAAA